MPFHRPAARLLVALVLALSLISGTAAMVAGAPPLRSSGPTNESSSTPEPDPTPASNVDPATSPASADSALAANDPTPYSSGSARPKPAPRIVAPTPTPRPATPTPSPTPTTAPTLVPTAVVIDDTVRLDEPVLRWLPEMVAASNATGTPITVIAGVMRLESSGDPNIVSVAGARGLMQIMPFHFEERGIPESLWHDPATNILVGASILAGNAAGGSWADAVAAYFGYGCDAYGTCTDQYVEVAFSWAAYYAPVLADLYGSVFAVLPSSWLPPTIAPQVETAPAPIATPPAAPAVATTATPTPKATSEPTAVSPAPTTPIPAPADTPATDPTLPPAPTATPVPPAVEPTPTEIPPTPTETPTEPPAPAPDSTDAQASASPEA